MKFGPLVRGAVVALAGLGVLLPAPEVMAGPQVRTVQASQLDLALQTNNALIGRVVDHSGAALSNREVIVRQGKLEVAKVSTDKDGLFVVENLKTGSYEVVAGATVASYRVWTESTAPEEAGQRALLVMGENGARGTWGYMASLSGFGGGIGLITFASLATAITIGTVSLVRINDLENQINNLPASP